MKNIFLLFIIVLLFPRTIMSGNLYGRIIQGNGSPLAKASISIDGKSIMTNEFGGYNVNLPDGEHELKIVIKNVAYLSEKITIFSPNTKQNWRIEPESKKLTKIK